MYGEQQVHTLYAVVAALSHHSNFKWEWQKLGWDGAGQHRRNLL